MPYNVPWPKLPKVPSPVSIPEGGIIYFEDPLRDPSDNEVSNFIVRTGLWGYNNQVKLALASFLCDRSLL